VRRAHEGARGSRRKDDPSDDALKKAIFEPTKCETCGETIITEGDPYKALLAHLKKKHPQDGDV
jgi:hypothetical protein